MSDDPELDAIRQRRLQQLLQDAEASPAPPEDASEGPVAIMGIQEFEQFVQQHEIVMVDFWAYWCGPCKSMDPVVAQLAEEWKGRVAVAKVDTDGNSDITSKFRISSIPTFLFFKRGQLVGRLVGARPKREFEDVIHQLETGT